LWGGVCSEKPNDLQDKPGGFSVLATYADKHAGCCMIPVLYDSGAASRFRWIVEYLGEIVRLISAYFSISCANRCLPGAAPDI
jgi:hypothetical protein